MSDVRTDDAPPLRRSTFANVALLLLVLSLGATLRYLRSTADGLTFDEMWHVELATGRGSAHGDLPRDTFIPAASSVTTLSGARPWYSIWTHMTGVVHPPLFVIALRAWMNVFGTTDLPAKWLSIVCQLIAIALLFDALRVWTNNVGIAFWAALLFAVAPAQVYAGQVVRGYAMLQMFGCATIAAVVRIERLGLTPRRAALLGLAALGVALSHYFGIAFDLAIGAYVLVRFSGRAQRDAFLALSAAGAVFVLAWGPFMWRQHGLVAATADSWLVEPGGTRAAHATGSLIRAAAIPVWQLLPAPDFSLRWPAVVGGAFLLAPIVLWRHHRDLHLWLYCLVGTIAFVAALDATRSTKQLIFPRYTALAAPALFALSAMLVWRFRIGAFRHVILAALAVAALARSGGAYGAREPEWHMLGALLEQTVDDHAAPSPADREVMIFYAGAGAFWLNDVYFLGATYTAPQLFPRPIVSLTKPADAPLVRSLPGRTVCLISSELERPADEVLPGTRILRQVDLTDLVTFTRLELPPKILPGGMPTAPSTVPSSLPATEASRR